MPEALAALAEAARLAPESARYGYVYAVALHEAGQVRPATEALERVLVRHPYDRDSLAALTGYWQQQGQPRRALAYARRLAALEPASAEIRGLVERLEAQPSR
jgi:cytochrome c-type biogenesis protein CcmH/NrfG